MIENPDGMEVFRIIDRQTGKARGSYSRACHDEYDFSSVEYARTANCGVFKDNEKFKINKYRVRYELIEEDVDGDTPPIACENCEHWVKTAKVDRSTTFVQMALLFGMKRICRHLCLVDEPDCFKHFKAKQRSQNETSNHK